jgi:hypothetical protein
MTGAGLMDFLITLVGLLIVGALIFAAIDFISTDERFKRLAKLAVGGALILIFLYAIRGVLFGGGGAAAISVGGLITFAIAVIVVLVVWYLISLFIDTVLGWFKSGDPAAAAQPSGLKDPIMFVVGALMLIAILYMAAAILFGGASYSPFRVDNNRHTQLEWSATREV